LWSLIDFLCMDRGTAWRKSRRKFQEFLLYIKSKFVNFLSLSLFSLLVQFLPFFLFCLFSILMTLMILDKFIFSPLSRNTQKCFLVSKISFIITILWFFKRDVVDIFDQTPPHNPPNAGKHSQLMYIFYRIEPTHNLSTFSSRFESRLSRWKLKESNDRVVKRKGKIVRVLTLGNIKRNPQQTARRENGKMYLLYRIYYYYNENLMKNAVNYDRQKNHK